MSEIIHLISGPRNISTALMYSFGNRADTDIVDEPFYSFYLTDSTVSNHPGKKEIIASMSPDPNEVIQQVLFKERSEQYLFVKNMAHHMRGFDYSYCKETKNIYLIREPKKLIASFAKVIEHPVADDIGIIREAELYNEISATSDQPQIVVDSCELLKDPEKILHELCRQLDIPFDTSMLSWEAGPRKADGVWASFWYKNVHKTTGFKKQQSSDTPLKEELVPLYLEVKPYYEQLFEKAIKA